MPALSHPEGQSVQPGQGQQQHMPPWNLESSALPIPLPRRAAASVSAPWQWTERICDPCPQPVREAVNLIRRALRAAMLHAQSRNHMVQAMIEELTQEEVGRFLDCSADAVLVNSRTLPNGWPRHQDWHQAAATDAAAQASESGASVPQPVTPTEAGTPAGSVRASSETLRVMTGLQEEARKLFAKIREVGEAVQEAPAGALQRPVRQCAPCRPRNSPAGVPQRRDRRHFVLVRFQFQRGQYRLLTYLPPGAWAGEHCASGCLHITLEDTDSRLLCGRARSTQYISVYRHPRPRDEPPPLPTVLGASFHLSVVSSAGSGTMASILDSKVELPRLSESSCQNPK